MSNWLAHSEGKNPPVPAQTYEKHIHSVVERVEKNIESLICYYNGNKEYFWLGVRAAATYHDLGKLDDKNQNILSEGGKKGLPINHVDAGTTALLKKDLVESALLVYSHHIGLQSIPNEIARAELFLRDNKLVEHTQKNLKEYLKRHNQSISVSKEETLQTTSDWNGITRRVALSCIVDGDHGDTADNYKKEYPIGEIELRWEERLASLDKYVKELGEINKSSERNQLRDKIYNSCKDADTSPSFYACDSPVGTGKTTAVMAHLLKTAIDKNLRHIIVVLPYTNIIKQSVDVYRKALVLHGENAEDIVAEHHHQSDFSSLESRQLTALWKAPIIVTTAVQFFETIASNHPSRLRKLHELPGSGIFIDEVHSAIPNHLWPQTWKWMKELSENWCCDFVLASGSLPRFWELNHMIENTETIPELVRQDLRKEALNQESKRIIPISHPTLLCAEELIGLIKRNPGPRLVIMNTVQSAAVLADKLKQTCAEVLHLSTALAPIHREIIVERVKERLKYKMNDWTLVATSCIEAGVDFSFRSAFRERSSAASLIQIGGRVRRNNEDFDATLIDFKVIDPLFNHHPGFTLSSHILEKLFEEKRFGNDTPADIITEALRRELMSDTEEKHKRIQKMETEMDYPEVAKLYRVIASDTRLVIVDRLLIDRLENQEVVDPKEIIKKSVQLWTNNINKLSVKSLRGYENSGLYAWPYDYDPDFLGYMKGIIPLLKTELEGFQPI